MSLRFSNVGDREVQELQPCGQDYKHFGQTFMNVDKIQ